VKGKTMVSDEKWISVEEAATLSGKTKRTVFNWLKAGKIKKTTKKGKNLFLDKNEFRGFLTGQKPKRPNKKKSKVSTESSVEKQENFNNDFIEFLKKSINEKDAEISRLNEKLDQRDRKLGQKDQELKSLYMETIALKDENSRLKDEMSKLGFPFRPLLEAAKGAKDALKGFLGR